MDRRSPAWLCGTRFVAGTEVETKLKLGRWNLLCVGGGRLVGARAWVDGHGGSDKVRIRVEENDLGEGAKVGLYAISRIHRNNPLPLRRLSNWPDLIVGL